MSIRKPGHNALWAHKWLWTKEEIKAGYPASIKVGRMGRTKKQPPGYEKYLDDKAERIQINALIKGINPGTGRRDRKGSWAKAGNHCMEREEG